MVDCSPARSRGYHSACVEHEDCGACIYSHNDGVLGYSLNVCCGVSICNILVAGDGINTLRWYVLACLLISNIRVFRFKHDLVLHEIFVVVGNEASSTSPEIAVRTSAVKKLLFRKIVHQFVLNGDETFQSVDWCETIA